MSFGAVAFGTAPLGSEAGSVLLTPSFTSSRGAWGVGQYGVSPWGASVTGGPPTIISVSPGIVDVAGGTVITIAGNNFNRTAVIEVLQGSVVLGYGLIALPDFDVQPNRLYVGLPALAAGIYDLHIATNNGDALLANAIEYREFASEYKVETARRKFGPSWNLGSRILSGG